jgi:hypothetical protein
MPIVITPSGEYVDSETGNPVVMPGMNRMQEMTSSNIPSNMDMGLESMTMDMDAINKVRLLMDMGLNEQDAIEAVVRERSMGTVRPEEFGGQQMQAQQQQAPMQQQMPMARPPMPSPGMGALPSAPPPRPDMSGMSREQMDMLRRGIDPFAEGMVR